MNRNPIATAQLTARVRDAYLATLETDTEVSPDRLAVLRSALLPPVGTQLVLLLED